MWRKTVLTVLTLCMTGLTALTALATTAKAQSSAALPEFEARYAVHAFNIQLGTSQQQLTCQDHHCTLTAIAKPSGFASLFVKEYTEERVTLQQRHDSLSWQGYQKITHRADGTAKTVTFEVTDSRPVEIFYPEKKRRWPMPDKLYDMASIAFALQFARLNNQPLSGFHLQDTDAQEAIDLTPIAAVNEVNLADFETAYSAEAYAFSTPKAKVRVWLLPQYNFFPAKIEVYNTDADKTIILVLEELPKFL